MSSEHNLKHASLKRGFVRCGVLSTAKFLGQTVVHVAFGVGFLQLSELQLSLRACVKITRNCEHQRPRNV